MNVEEMREKIELCDETQPYLFVSYSKKNADKVYPIVLKLQEMGINIWIDKNLENQAGKSWQEKAFAAIMSGYCEKVVFFMSVDSFFSLPVCAELKYTLHKAVKLNHDGNKVEVIPVSIDDAGNIGKVINKCRADSRCKEEIGEAGYKNIFSNCLNDDELKIFSAKFNYSAIITHIFQTVFEENTEINVVSDVPSIIKNIPSEMVTIQNNKVDVTDERKNEKTIQQSIQKENKDFERSEVEKKTEEGNIESNINDKISSSYFEEHKNDKDLIDNEQKAIKFYDEFKSKFSPEKLKELSGLTLLRSIFLNDEGNQTNICSLFEYNKDYIQFGSIKGGTALKHVLYYSAKEKSWMTGKPPITFNKLTEQEAIELGTKIRDNIVKACEIVDKYKDKLNTEEAYEQMYNEIDNQADGIHKVLFVKKYFHMIYKDLFPCMFSTGYIRKTADLFGYEKNLDETKYIAKFEMTKNQHGISNYLFSLIIYKFLNETTGTSSSESKILNY